MVIEPTVVLPYNETAIPSTAFVFAVTPNIVEQSKLDPLKYWSQPEIT